MIQFDFDPKRKYATITGDYFDQIREHFSVADPNAKHQKKFNRYVNPRKYAITPTGKFKIGLYGEIRKYLVENQILDQIILSDSFKDAINPSLSGDFISNLSFSNREYQTKAVNLCKSFGRGIVLIGTGGGKTLTMASLLDNIYYYTKNKETFKALIIVPDIGLASQTLNDFIEYNVPFKVTKWTGSDDLDLTSNVIIANSSIILNRFEENDWIKYVDVLLVDEVHKLKSGNKISKVVEEIKTYNKFGFTGTLPDDPYEKWNIIGLIGPVLFTKSGSELREEKYITEVEAKIIQILYNSRPSDPIPDDQGRLLPNAWYLSEMEFIYSHPYRNRVIHSICNNFNENILILIDHIDLHGLPLYNFLKAELSHKQVFFIRGEVDVQEREEIQQIMERDNNVVCIAVSKIFATGISINNIHMIMFAAAGKAFIKTVQAIGRGVRLHERKKKLVIIDLADQLRYGIEHSQNRIRIYESEKIPYTVTKLVEKSL